MTGSVRKRGAKWYIVYDAPRIDPHKRNQVWEPVGTNKREAEARLAEKLNAVNKGDYVARSRVTVGDYLRKHWLPVQRTRVAPKTYERWDGIAKRLCAEFGPIPIAALRKTHITQAYTKWLASGGRHGAGLSPLTVRHIHRALSHALKRAVGDGYAGRNVCDFVELPRVDRKKMTVVDESQVPVLLETFRGTGLEFLVKLALYSGLRRGELLGLTWGAVEFDRSRILVRQSLEQIGGAVRVKEPKSKHGYRTVGLDPEIMEGLGQRRLSQRKHRLAFGLPHREDDYVFPAPNHVANKAWTPHNVSDSFRWHAGRAAGLPKGLRFHDLRHSHVALMGKAKMDPHVVSQRVGHSSVAFTLDVYGHVFERQDQEAASAFAALIEKGA